MGGSHKVAHFVVSSSDSPLPWSGQPCIACPSPALVMNRLRGAGSAAPAPA